MAATRYQLTHHPVPHRSRRAAGGRGAIDGGTMVLAAVLSIVAALTTMVLASIGDVSRWSLVLSVTVIGFVASWVRSGSAMRRRPAIITVSH